MRQVSCLSLMCGFFESRPTWSDPNSDDGQYSPYPFGSGCADFGAHYIEHHRSPTLVVQRPTFEPPALTELTERWRTGEMDDGSHLLHLNE